MKKRDVLSSPRLLEIKKKKRRVLKIKLAFFLAGLIVVFVGLCFLSRIPKLNIANIEVVGNKIVETDDIKKVAEGELTGFYLWFLPKTNFTLYPKGRIALLLGEQHTRLKDINLNLKKDGVLEISVGERVGLYTWCGETLPSLGVKPEETKCYFMDESGYIFDEAPYFSNDVYLKFFGITDKGVSEDPTGSRYLPDYFSAMTHFMENIISLDIKPSSLLVKENGKVKGEIEIYLSSNILPPSAPRIIFNKGDDLVKLAENLQASVDADPFKTELKEKREKLEYIDLRFDNRVYYKFK
ncbi:hypothetical protein A2914_02700 [Candidatus Nomurabacteria bacterium RIFCSPLOWO2_01_FULL_41_21]|uniref:POTRA domain-containing protein n=2 Tax=Candidatus Nomuraibacteriota TaxID=1752729 RepID=A0A1F6V1I3_9BACT|nr:MAG: hypothetical protein A2733_00365 [Candidatus Nomurabacteria bacterium RIFCSPHIGHO2_01_FULL_40_20]OGI88903.1 MAG: hypothetical protein A2914_02700 [Candidatus Nomurabacteria bacterium RIFCSPLOWO2_01_FULL_41_21]